MAIYNRQSLSEAGVSLTANAATATVGDSSDNTDGKLAIIIRNGSAGSISFSATVQSAPSVNDPARGLLSKNIAALTVAAGATAILGPFPPSVYNDVNNRVTYIASSVTSVTVSPVTLP